MDVTRKLLRGLELLAAFACIENSWQIAVHTPSDCSLLIFQSGGARDLNADSPNQQSESTAIASSSGVRPYMSGRSHRASGLKSWTSIYRT